MRGGEIQRRLMLMRHAKSSWKSQVPTDHERPLNERGRRDAARVGKRLAKLGYDYDVRWMEQELSWREELVMHLRGGAARVVNAVAPRRAVLPQLGETLDRARALLALAAEGRPVYLCSCRVE